MKFCEIIIVSTSSHAITGVINENANTSGDYQLSLFTVKGGISQIQRSQIIRRQIVVGQSMQMRGTMPMVMTV